MRADTERKIQEAIAGVTDEGQQIDVIARQRGYFMPDADNAFYATVQQYMNNKLNIKQVTNKLLSPIDDAILANKKNLNLMVLWNSIIHTAKRTPYRDDEGHTKLVELMKAIKVHSPPPTAARKDIYSSLSGFGMSARETMDNIPGCGGGYLTPEGHAHANMAYFYACLTKEHVCNFWIYVIWDMRGALENEHNDDKPDRAHHPGTAVQKYNALVPAAAAWVFALGRLLYDKEQDLTQTRTTRGDPGKGGPLWKGKSEFSKGRWALWKSRFKEIAGMDEVGEETRRTAKEAARVMNESEKA
jgi:hypothetical protein